MNNHVVSLELSEILRELGSLQESQFYWQRTGQDSWEIWGINDYDEYSAGKYKDQKISAYITSEIGLLLPELVDIEGVTYYIVSQRGLAGNLWYSLLRECNYHRQFRLSWEDKLEVNARAKMYAYLLENRFIL